MKPWKILARRKLMDGDPWLRVWAEDLRLPDGQTVEGFYTVEMPDYVAVVAQTPDGRVVAERNYKHGPGRVCLNLPAGYMDRGESPMAAARRELYEETGYRAEEWTQLGSFTNDGNRGCGVGHLFLARGTRQEDDPRSGDLEEMEIALVSLDELAAALRDGEVPVLGNAAAIALAMLEIRDRSPYSHEP